MITRLTIQHFRSIESLDLSLGAVSVLVGQNGVGKSNIIDAVTFVRDSLKNGLDPSITERQGIHSIRQWSRFRPYNISISLDVNRDLLNYGRFSFTLSSVGGDYAIRREEGFWHEHRNLRVRDRRAKSGYTTRAYESSKSYSRQHDGVVHIWENSTDESGRIELEEIDEFFLNSRFAFTFRGLRDALTDFERYAIFPNTLRQPEKQSSEIYLKTHGDNLASVLRRMRKKKRGEATSEIINSLSQALPTLRAVNVQSIAGHLTPVFLVGEAGESKPHQLHVNQMSDGTLRILGLLVALYQEPHPMTIALEEPELTIHPGVLQIVSDSIREVTKKYQVLITTHSPSFLDFFKPEEIIAVELRSGVTVAGLT